jgi:hypothetical protein
MEELDQAIARALRSKGGVPRPVEPVPDTEASEPVES